MAGNGDVATPRRTVTDHTGLRAVESARREAPARWCSTKSRQRTRAKTMTRAMKPEQQRTLAKKELRERGWRPSMIRDLLGEPDATKRNPRYASAAPMALYAVERVKTAEATEAFRSRLEQAEAAHAARSQAQRRVMETKRKAQRSNGQTRSRSKSIGPRARAQASRPGSRTRKRGSSNEETTTPTGKVQTQPPSAAGRATTCATARPPTKNNSRRCSGWWERTTPTS